MLKNITQWTAFLLFFVVISCSPKQENIEYKIYDNTTITKNIVVDSGENVTQLIKVYKKNLESVMNEQIGYSSMYMPNGDKPEGLLSNMVADFTYNLGRKYCKQQGFSHTVDGAIINMGGLRKGMPKGIVTLGDIYEISPFENKLHIVAMYGKDLWQLFDHITRSGGEGVGNIHLKANAKTKKLETAYINGKPLEDGKLYYIISIDYLINGGDGMVAFSKNVKSIDLNLKSRDALLNYVKEEYKAKRPLQSKLDKRISYE